MECVEEVHWPVRDYVWDSIVIDSRSFARDAGIAESKLWYEPNQSSIFQHCWLDDEFEFF